MTADERLAADVTAAGELTLEAVARTAIDRVRFLEQRIDELTAITPGERLLAAALELPRDDLARARRKLNALEDAARLVLDERQ